MIAVTARWDANSRTWWTDGDDVPGLCCQGGTFEELSDAVFALVPDLLVTNGTASQGEEIDFVLAAKHRKTSPGEAHIQKFDEACWNSSGE